MKKTKRLLYIYPVEAEFVEKDVRSLSTDFNISKLNFNFKKKDNKLIILFYHIKFLLQNIKNYDIYIVKFAGLHSFFPALICSLTNKKLVIIPGGTDCVSFPSIHYGNFLKPLLRFLTKFSYKYSELILPVHKSLILSDYSYIKLKYPKQGIQFHYPKLRSTIKEIINGYDSKKWHLSKPKVKGRFITVASYATNERRILLKGLDLMIEAAKLFPKLEFIIIGTNEEDFPVNLPNLKLLPMIANNDLVDHYSQAEFYLQLSLSEGFPNSLCEAMLCECVPIVSNVASMPFIVQDSGFILERKDLKQLEKLIDQALNSDTKMLGEKARRRVAENFTEEDRSKKLIEAIDSI